MGQEQLQADALLGRARIARTAGIVQPTLVADADGMFVITAGMCPLLVEGATRVNHAIARNVVVIANVGKAPGTVVATAVVHGVTTGGACGTTMNYYQVYAPVLLVLAAVKNGVAQKN